MWKLLLLLSIYIVNGHNNKLRSDADLQSELIPQELNPFFVPAEHPPLPMPLRLRRNTDVVVPETSTTTMQQVKTYSRIVAGVVLVLSAIVEVVVYILEAYA